MLRPLVTYLKNEVTPRWRKILITWEVLISIAVMLAFVLFGPKLFALFPKVSDIATDIIAYAAIALGFCIAGLTISLTFPEPKFTKQLAAISGTTSPYSDLLFVFSWTAIAHWFAVLLMFVIMLVSDGSCPLLPAGYSRLRLWVVGLTAGLSIYCLCQFLITLITLSQVGSVYIKHLRSPE